MGFSQDPEHFSGGVVRSQCKPGTELGGGGASLQQYITGLHTWRGVREGDMVVDSGRLKKAKKV